MDSESTTETKKCPFCAEDVARQALKCKHCGEFFETTERTVREKTRIPALVVAALILGAAVSALALNFWGDGGGDVAPGAAASTDASLDIAATAVPSPSPNATPSYSDFLQEISGKRWSIGSMPCETNGGAYQVFSTQRGQVWTAGGKEQIGEARSRFAVLEKDADSFVMKVEFLANDLVANNLGDPNAVSARTTYTVRRSSDGGIDYHKKIEMLNFDAMFRGIRRYDVTHENGRGTLCRNQPSTQKPPADEFNKTFISGDWVYDISHCTVGTDNFWRFNRDNTYVAPGTFGTFSIKANTLYLKFNEPTDGKESENLSIKRVNGGIRIGGAQLYKCPKSN